MSWNIQPQGVYPAATGVTFHSGDIPRPVPNPNFALIQDAIKTVSAVLEKRRQDQIANQLLAVDTAPQAEAMDGTVRGSGQPDTALTQAMVAKNLGLGYPTTAGAAPDLGGVDALKLHDAMQQSMAHQQKAALDAALVKARISHLQNIGSRSSGGGGGIVGDTGPDTWTGPDGSTWAIGPRGGLTKVSGAPGQAEVKPNKMETSLEGALAPLAESPATFGQIQDKPDMVTFWTPDYQRKISTQEAQTTEGAQAVLPNKIVVPYEKYKGLQDRFNAVQAYRDATGASSPETQAPAPPAAAVEYLKAHPEAAQDFDTKYGTGASQRYL